MFSHGVEGHSGSPFLPGEGCQSTGVLVVQAENPLVACQSSTEAGKEQQRPPEQ